MTRSASRVAAKSLRAAAATRSKRRYDAAARTLAPIALDAEHAAALEAGIQRTGMTAAAYVRELILAARGPLK